MSLLSLEELKKLVEQPKGLCVSIYMPIQRAGVELQQNSPRLKNLKRDAENKILESGLSEGEAWEFLQPIQNIIDSNDETFWQQYNGDGLAIFVASGVCHYYRLPLNFQELVVVTDHFHLKPLLPLLIGDEKYYVLALSQQDVRLLECTRYSVREIGLEDV
ncbi:MAG TPA: hypothetical protein V6D50_26705, partial [Chroococcales cyanobacterium]